MSFGGDSGGTNESRREEADERLERILGYEGDLSDRELEFIESCSDPDRVITSRMIFWLRDIVEKIEEL